MKKKFKIAVIFFPLILLVCAYSWKGSSLVPTYVAIATILLLVFIKNSFLVVNKRFQNTNWYKNKFIGTDKFINGEKYRTNTTRNYDIANVGSMSGTFAFDYEDSGIIGLNWSAGSESLSYNFRVLKNYFSFLKDGGTIIFTITPFGFCLKDYADDKLNTKYYLYLDPKSIINYSRFKYFFRIKYPLFSWPIEAIKRLIKDVPADNLFFLTRNPMSSEEIEKDALRWINSWKKQFSIPELNGPISESNLDNIAYNTNLLKEMISFCLERNLQPVMVLPPTTKALASKFSGYFCESYIYSIIRNSNTHQIPFLNYLNDTRFADTELFVNSFFLNAKGRKIFTQTVLKDLKIV